MPGGGGEKTVQTTTQEMSPEQRQLLEGVIPIAQGVLTNPPKQYPGSGIAPQTPAELQAQQMALQAAQQMQGVTSQIPQQLANISQGQAGNINQVGGQVNAGQDQLNAIMSAMFGATGQQIGQGQAASAPALGTLMDPNILNADSNPALQSYIQAAVRPLSQQFSEVTMPGISQDAITAGGFGGSRQGIAEGLAAGRLAQATGDTTAKIASEGYGQGLQAMLGGVNANTAQQSSILDAMSKMFNTGVTGSIGGTQNALAGSQQQSNTLMQMMQGLSLTPDILASMTKPAEVTGAVGAQQRADQQARLSEAVQKFATEQMLPFTLAQQVAGMAFGMPGGTTTSTGQTVGGNSGMQALGALPMLMSLFGL